MTAPLLHPGALADPSAAGFERLFLRNGWSNSWRNGVYDWHHYHTTTHEVLGCHAGEAVVFSWIEWPSREARDAGNAKVMADPRMQMEGREMPFSMERMIFGGFLPIVEA